MNCKTCPNYHAIGSVSGQCRIGTPILMWSPLAVDAVNATRTTWPEVKADDWCSHHPERQITNHLAASKMAERYQAQIEAEQHRARGGRAS